MANQRELHRLVRALRALGQRSVEHYVQENRFGIVRQVSPLSIELQGANSIALSEGQVVLSHAVRKYDADWGLAVDDTLVLVAVALDDWVAVAVISGVDGTGTPGLGASTQVFNETPAGVKNGSNVTFTVSQPPSTGKCQVARNGLVLAPTDDFAVSGTTITFVIPPKAADHILATYLPA